MKTFLAHSLGCRTNQAEIEEITNDLAALGFTPWSKNPKHPKAPNLILINTCVVTQKAERETKQTIRKMRRAYHHAFLVVLGCGVDAQQKLKIDLPQANLLISNQEKPNTAKIVIQKLGHSSQQRTIIRQFDKFDKYSSSGRKLIAVQTGCNQYCTFCIVPYLRGKPRSKTIHKIIKTLKHEHMKTINKFVSGEIKEIILTGINLSLYGKDLRPQATLTQLLKKILKETNIPRISLSSLTPEVITKDFINLYINDWKNNDGRLSRYWHLAIQSGSPRILKRMGRKTNPKALKTLKDSLQSIKVKIPEFVFRADFLVGFPGETEKDFQLTLQLIKVLKISFSHVFPFSKRPRTIAYKMIQKGLWQDLPPQVKKERVKQVIQETKKLRNRETKKLIGKILPCLFLDKQHGYWKTLADNSWPIRVKTSDSNSNPKGSVKHKGQIRRVKITEVRTDYLLGEILSLPT